MHDFTSMTEIQFFRVVGKMPPKGTQPLSGQDLDRVASDLVKKGDRMRLVNTFSPDATCLGGGDELFLVRKDF